MKLSDYILEQDISTASIADIDFEQCFAEMNVFATALDCCMKQEMILEYATGYISDFSIFQEGMFMESDEEQAKDGVKEKKELFLKRWWKSLIEVLKRVGNMIVGWFSKVNYGSLKKSVEDSDVKFYSADDIKLLKAMIHSANIQQLIVCYRTFVEALSDQETDLITFKKIKELVDVFDLAFKNIESEKPKPTDNNVGLDKAEMLKFLTEMEEIQKNEIPKFKQILKNANFDIKNYDTKTEEGKNIVQLIKEIGKKMPIVYSKMNERILKTTAKVIKQCQKKGNAPAKDEGDGES